jgi:DeoR family transcriptional regulator, aga operon transcriptional repressor
MTQQQRLNDLLELVSDRGNVTIAEISEVLSISAATARRDLTTLAEQRLVTRTHGGASALGTGYELPLQYKIARQADAKMAIARAAVELVSPGDIVGFNGGTTTSEVARTLGKGDRLIRSDGEFGVTIVTNALNIAYELSVRPHVKIVVTGGIARRQSYELIGPLVSNILGEVVLDVAILGVDGLSAQFGATTLHEGEAEVSREFVKVAKQVVVVADSTKLTRATFARICDLSEIDTLITDAQPDDHFLEQLTIADVRLIVAE